jgi:Tol biopolymer transport system component
LKIVFRLLAIFLLMTVAALTPARQNASGAWIAYTSVTQFNEYNIHLMTGDGREHRDFLKKNACGYFPRWSPDGKWIAAVNDCPNPAELIRIRPGGGWPILMTQDTLSIVDAPWSPDGEHFMMLYGNDILLWQAGQVGQQPFGESLYSPQWSADGQWIYGRPTQGNDPILIRYNVQTHASEIIIDGSGGVTNLAWSPDGVQMAAGLMRDDEVSLLLMSPDGSNRQTYPLDLPSAQMSSMLWSPNGKWIVFVRVTSDGGQIYRIRPDGSGLQSLTEGALPYSNLDWSPDGEWLIFVKAVGDANQIFRMRADGSSLEQLTSGSRAHLWPDYAPVYGKAWHPFGLTIAALALMFIPVMKRRR